MEQNIPDVPETSEGQGPSRAEQSKSLKVLVLVDKPVEATLVRFMLAESREPRFEFRWATTFSGAVRLLRNEKIDLILTDLFLPDMMGLDTVESIKQAAEAVPIVLLVRQEDEMLAISAVRAGVQDYLIKGQIGTSLLLKTVRQAIHRKQLELEHRRMQEHIRRAEKAESLSMLAGGVAHDFSNLLAAILGNSEIALRRVEEMHPARKHLKSIIQSSLQATELTQKMLAYTGNSNFRMGRHDLEQVISDVRRRLRTSFDIGSLVVDVASDLPELLCDLDRVRDLITHLMINALEAVADTGGNVAIQAELDGPQVVLKVIDSGAGMEAEVLRRAFDPFFTTKFTGRGLGLSAAMGIVRGHGGDIQIESNPKSGTTVTVHLPIDGPRTEKQEEDLVRHEPAVDRGAYQVPGLDPALQSDPGVLVIDDEAPLRELAEDILTECGFKVYLASDGESGLQQLRANFHSICLVILDVVLPDSNGRDIFRQIEQIDPSVRVLLASGYDARVAEDLSDSKCFIGFLQKPFSLENMVSVVEEALDRPREAGSYQSDGVEESIESQFDFSDAGNGNEDGLIA
ncbi:MAG: response regulator [Phycisphaerae bacterium]